MKYIMCSRHFPAGHPRKGEPTYFVEQILNATMPRGVNNIINSDAIDPDIRPYINDFVLLDGSTKKPHTIRNGSRFSTGEMVSLRVWSDLPYRSKQIEFAQVEVKKVWAIEINNRFGAGSFEVVINGVIFAQLHYGNDADLNKEGLIMLAKNDGLEFNDFVNWFNIHPKKKGEVFRGQIICWSDQIEYIDLQTIKSEA